MSFKDRFDNLLEMRLSGLAKQIKQCCMSNLGLYYLHDELQTCQTAGYMEFSTGSELAVLFFSAFFFLFIFATIEVRIGVHIAVVMVDAAT